MKPFLCFLLIVAGTAATAPIRVSHASGVRPEPVDDRQALCPSHEAAASADSLHTFDQLVDEYFDEYFKYYPSEGTAAGLHQYDHLLGNYSKAAADARVSMLKKFLARFQGLDRRQLPPLSLADCEMVVGSIQAELLELEEIRAWEKDPDLYSRSITRSVFVIEGRSFAPPAERLKTVVTRERQMPRALAAARANLNNPPRVGTEVALEQLPGIIAYFQNDLGAAFKDVADTDLQTDFRTANQAVIDALRDYQQFLRDDLLPRSKGDFRIGAENFRKKLLYDEMVDIPLERLLEIGYEDLRANQKRFAQTAREVDPHRPPEAILADAVQDHPAPDRLLESVRNELDGLREFIAGHKILTIPSPTPPVVKESPPYKRAFSWASMNTPGSFENRAKEAYYFVTLPQATWPKQQIEEYMQGWNRGTIVSTSIHEAYPGHYIQFLWIQRAPSKVRKLLGCESNSEGWAHYTEQMMLDEGYGSENPKRHLRLRLGQLQDALLRNARFIVGIQMHTGSMTCEEAVDFFVREGYQTRAAAVREVKRGASDPTYLVYTLGKLAVLRLRDDYKKLRGERFTLQEFHDEFLKQGYPPIRLIRRTMLGKDGPIL